MRLRSVIVATGMLVLSACTLFVSTTGLSDGETPAPPDSATVETGTPTDAATDAPVPPNEAGTDAGVDATPPCTGLVTTSGWSEFTRQANVTVAGATLTASVTTSAVGQDKQAVATYEKGFAPKTLHVVYDMDIRPNPTMYFEPGCSIFVYGANGDTLFRHIPGLSGTGLREYVNVYTTAGSDDRERVLGAVPSGTSSHHVDVTFKITGTSAVVDTIFDGTTGHFDAITLLSLAEGFYVNCGIPYSSQVSGTSGNLTVDVRAFTLSACP